jgi:hypothetical protein
MKKVLLFLVFLFIGIALFVWVVKAVGWKEIKLVFISFSIWKGTVIFILTILAALVRTWRWKIILKSQGYDIPSREVAEYYLSGLSISFLVPMVILGGEVFRCYDLKEKYSLPWVKSIASVIIDRILELTVSAIVIISGLFFFLSQAGLTFSKATIIILTLISLAILAIVFFYVKSFRKESIIRFFLKRINFKNSSSAETVIDVEREIFDYFHPRKKSFWEGLALSLVVGMLLLERAFLLIMFLTKRTGFFLALSVMGFSYLAVTPPIPAAIGSHEFVQSFVFNNLGLGANTGAAFALIIRGAEFILALIGAIFFIKLGIEMLVSAIVGRLSRFLKK